MRKRGGNAVEDSLNVYVDHPVPLINLEPIDRQGIPHAVVVSPSTATTRRDEFLKACRDEEKPAAQLLREFMRTYVGDRGSVD
jgi:hypothetical protein